jgi:sulfite reductase beta subunit-like hemoprotein
VGSKVSIGMKHLTHVGIPADLLAYCRDLITVQQFWYDNGDCHQQKIRFIVIKTGLENKENTPLNQAAFRLFPGAWELEFLRVRVAL